MFEKINKFPTCAIRKCFVLKEDENGKDAQYHSYGIKHKKITNERQCKQFLSINFILNISSHFFWKDNKSGK